MSRILMYGPPIFFRKRADLILRIACTAKSAMNAMLRCIRWVISANPLEKKVKCPVVLYPVTSMITVTRRRIYAMIRFTLIRTLLNFTLIVIDSPSFPKMLGHPARKVNPILPKAYLSLISSAVPSKKIAWMACDTTSCTVLLLGINFSPLRNVLIWMDVRSSSHAERIAGSGTIALKYNGYGGYPYYANRYIDTYT
jgi:hypothetical protein